MKRKVEFIESYIKIGNDYQWNDNHGELIRCKDCKYRDEDTANCTRFRKDWYVQSNSFCSWAERKETS